MADIVATPPTLASPARFEFGRSLGLFGKMVAKPANDSARELASRPYGDALQRILTGAYRSQPGEGDARITAITLGAKLPPTFLAQANEGEIELGSDAIPQLHLPSATQALLDAAAGLAQMERGAPAPEGFQRAANIAADTLRHEIEHTVTPARITEKQDADRARDLEEGMADLLSVLPERRARFSAETGLPYDPSLPPVSAYRKQADELRELFHRAGVNIEDPMGEHTARELLQTQPNPLTAYEDLRKLAD